MKKPSLFGLVLGVALLAASCIKEDASATWYIEAGGKVTWSVLERNIRSDSSSRDERITEEDHALILARAHGHPAELGLNHLGATAVKTTITRDRAPFSVLTEGEFSSLDMLGRRFLTTYGMVGQSTLSRDGDNTVWTMTLDGMHDGSNQDAAELTVLLGDALHVTLHDGTFISAEGFSIDDDKRTAVLQSDFFDGPDDKHRVLKLVWRADSE